MNKLCFPDLTFKVIVSYETGNSARWVSFVEATAVSIRVVYRGISPVTKPIGTTIFAFGVHHEPSGVLLFILDMTESVCYDLETRGKVTYQMIRDCFNRA